jgi:hypothetical protein
MIPAIAVIGKNAGAAVKAQANAQIDISDSSD